MAITENTGTPPLVSRTVNLGEALATTPLQISLPLVPGSIVDGTIRTACYQLLTRELQNTITKWGFKNYALYLDWPDADNQPPISVINVDMGHFKTYLGMMLMQMAGQSALTRIQFLKEFAKVIDQFGMLEQFRMLLDQEAVAHGNGDSRPPFRIENNGNEPRDDE